MITRSKSRTRRASAARSPVSLRHLEDTIDATGRRLKGMMSEATDTPRKLIKDAAQEAAHMYQKAAAEASQLYDQTRSEAAHMYQEAAQEAGVLYRRTVSEASHLYQETKRWLSYHELPEWMCCNNPHIASGYRPPMPLKRALMSLLEFHNETVNVWTHLLGFVFMLYLTVREIAFLWDAPMVDKAIFLVFFCSALLCLGCSTLYHLLYCHSQGSCYIFSLLDYSGIATLIVGSFYPVTFYAFARGPIWQFTYLALITGLGLIGIVGPFFPVFHTDRFHLIRAIIFGGTTAVGIIPSIHVRWYILDESIHVRIYAMFLLYGIGFFFYLSRIPERWWPGKFDYVLSSHQIWHVFVVAAVYAHYTACVALYQHWLDIGECPAL